jgi:hypothetical protein
MESAMKNEDLLKCPLLQGLDAMHRAELLGLINDSSLREKLEGCMGRLKENQECTECKPDAVAQSGYSEEGPHWNPGPKLWPAGAKE